MMIKLLVLTLLLFVHHGFAEEENLDEQPLDDALLRELFDQLESRDSFNRCLSDTKHCSGRGFCTKGLKVDDADYFCHCDKGWRGYKCDQKVYGTNSVRELLEKLRDM